MLGAFVGTGRWRASRASTARALSAFWRVSAYRRRGLGEALLRGRCGWRWSGGRAASGQVLIDNAPSLALQKKVGMTVAREPLYWLFRR